MKAEQRKHPRRSAQVPFRARPDDAVVPLGFESRNLSAGGVFLCTDLLLEPGEALTVEFALPDVKRTIYGRVRVVWVRRFPANGQDPGMGVRFVDLSAEDLRALQSFVEK
jgi:uncharacterized protein (TIGR02266 family)